MGYSNVAETLNNVKMILRTIWTSWRKESQTAIIYHGSKTQHFLNRFISKTKLDCRKSICHYLPIKLVGHVTAGISRSSVTIYHNYIFQIDIFKDSTNNKVDVSPVKMINRVWARCSLLTILLREHGCHSPMKTTVGDGMKQLVCLPIYYRFAKWSHKLCIKYLVYSFF